VNVQEALDEAVASREVVTLELDLDIWGVADGTITRDETTKDGYVLCPSNTRQLIRFLVEDVVALVIRGVEVLA
jgi:hypothetical protein